MRRIIASGAMSKERIHAQKDFKEKPKTPEEHPSFKKSQLGVLLTGCPLDKRISEFHKLKTQGVAVGSLAMIVVDNPMAAGTGHRICNDCMKSCIFQKQDPVDIPQVETRSLRMCWNCPGASRSIAC